MNLPLFTETYQSDYLLKILIVGDARVGKSSLLMRFSDNVFDETYIPTIGVDFKIRTIEVLEYTVKLQIWDTAGQERFRAASTSGPRIDVHGIFIVYDVTNIESLRNTQNWLQEITRYNIRQKPRLLLVGNKTDLTTERQVTSDYGREFAEQLGLRFIEVSAKSSVNVEDAFRALAKEIIQKALEDEK